MIFPIKSVTWHDPVNAAKYLSDSDLSVDIRKVIPLVEVFHTSDVASPNDRHFLCWVPSQSPKILQSKQLLSSYYFDVFLLVEVFNYACIVFLHKFAKNWMNLQQLIYTPSIWVEFCTSVWFSWAFAIYIELVSTAIARRDATNALVICILSLVMLIAHTLVPLNMHFSNLVRIRLSSP